MTPKGSPIAAFVRPNDEAASACSFGPGSLVADRRSVCLKLEHASELACRQLDQLFQDLEAFGFKLSMVASGSRYKNLQEL